MKQDKRIIPECEIVPGMGSSIDYAELIKRDANTVTGTAIVPKKENVKVKRHDKYPYTIRRKV